MVAYREKQLWNWEVHLALRSIQYISQPSRPGKAKVTIERHGHKLLDPDNLVGGFKALIDGLKVARLIVDDSPAHLELVAKQAKGKPRTIVTVEAA